MNDITESSGHSRHLREVLRDEWERFNRHPAIDVMAAWAMVNDMVMRLARRSP